MILPLVVIDVQEEAAKNPDYTLSLERVTKWEKDHGQIPAGGSDVRAPLANVREEFREKSGAHRLGTLVVPVNCLTRFVRKTGLPRNSRRKLVRKIDVFLRREDLLDLPELQGICVRR